MKPTDLVDINDNILVKMEINNLSGSHKFRAASYIIEKGIEDGLINEKTTIIEKTGGNFGFGLLAACLSRNIPVELAIGLSFSMAKKEKLKDLGAILIGKDMLESGKSPKEVIEWHLENQEMLGKKYFYTDQFNNIGSYFAHIQTGNEISSQLMNAFPKVNEIIMVGCAGTGASFSGISDSLEKNGYKVKRVLVEPRGCDSKNNIFISHRMEGMSVGVTPPFIKWDQIDEFYHVSDRSLSEIRKDIFKRYGLLVGHTSSACYEACVNLESECSDTRKILTFFYDSGIWYD